MSLESKFAEPEQLEIMLLRKFKQLPQQIAEGTMCPMSDSSTFILVTGNFDKIDWHWQRCSKLWKEQVDVGLTVVIDASSSYLALESWRTWIESWAWAVPFSLLHIHGFNFRTCFVLSIACFEMQSIKRRWSPFTDIVVWQCSLGNLILYQRVCL